MEAKETGALSTELGLDEVPERKRPGRKPANRYEAGRIDGTHERIDEREPARHAERIPLHVQRMAGNASDVPKGYHGHWVSDGIAGRIDKLLLAGYTFATKDGKFHANPSEGNGIDSRISRPGGGGSTHYLMIIPLDIYESDQKAKQALADEQLAGLPLNHDPSLYSRDAQGREVAASEFIRVEENRR